MKHFLLKFNHGVEIGARLAYLGHAKRLNSEEINRIAQDEFNHRILLGYFLYCHNEKPSLIIDIFFNVVGSIIGFLCKFFPEKSLSFVATSLEIFAVSNYKKLAEMYPEWKEDFLEMAKTEDRHKEFFKCKR